jgi:hypothetical protein
MADFFMLGTENHGLHRCCQLLAMADFLATAASPQPICEDWWRHHMVEFWLFAIDNTGLDKLKLQKTILLPKTVY